MKHFPSEKAGIPSYSETEVFSSLTMEREVRLRACNHIYDLPLKNEYFLIRHGKSEANVAGIHSGNQESGKYMYGLTEEGKQQVRESIENEMAAGFSGDDLIICSSAFLRARETAAIAAELLKVSNILIDQRLGERGAGMLEGKASDPEQKKLLGEIIKERDLLDPFHCTFGIESPASVLSRVTDFVAEVEKKYEGRRILLVGHHDTFQILRTACRREPPGESHNCSRLRNAGFVNLSAEALPVN